MSLIDSLKDLVLAARSAAGKLHAADQRIRAEIAKLEDEERHLLGAPAPSEDVAATIRQLVDEAGVSWRAMHGAAIRAAASGRIERTPARPDQRPPDVLRPGGWPDDFTLQLAGLVPVTLPSLCALAPELVVAGLTRAVETPEAAGERPPMSMRLRRLEEIGAQITKLQREHASLVSAAAEVQITLSPLPENEAARRRAERESEAREGFNRANADAIKRGAVKAMTP